MPKKLKLLSICLKKSKILTTKNVERIKVVTSTNLNSKKVIVREFYKHISPL